MWQSGIKDPSGMLTSILTVHSCTVLRVFKNETFTPNLCWTAKTLYLRISRNQWTFRLYRFRRSGSSLPLFILHYFDGHPATSPTDVAIRFNLCAWVTNHLYLVFLRESKQIFLSIFLICKGKFIPQSNTSI